MRRTKRWIVAATVAMATTMAIPTAASAALGGRGDVWEDGRMTTSAVRRGFGEAGGGLAGWLRGFLSSIWGATRGTIIPGDAGHLESTNGGGGVDLVGGGA